MKQIFKLVSLNVKIKLLLADDGALSVNDYYDIFTITYSYIRQIHRILEINLYCKHHTIASTFSCKYLF